MMNVRQRRIVDCCLGSCQLQDRRKFGDRLDPIKLFDAGPLRKRQPIDRRIPRRKQNGFLTEPHHEVSSGRPITEHPCGDWQGERGNCQQRQHFRKQLFDSCDLKIDLSSNSNRISEGFGPVRY